MLSSSRYRWIVFAGIAFIVYQNCDFNKNSFTAEIIDSADQSSLAKLDDDIQNSESSLFDNGFSGCNNRAAIAKAVSIQINDITPSRVESNQAKFKILDLNLNYKDMGMQGAIHQFQCSILPNRTSANDNYYGLSLAVEKCLLDFKNVAESEKALSILIEKGKKYFISKNIEIKNINNLTILSTDSSRAVYNLRSDSPIAYDLMQKDENGVPLIPADLRPTLTRCKSAELVGGEFVETDKADEATFEISNSQNISIAGFKFDLNTIVTGKGTHAISFNQAPSSNIQIVNNFFYDELRLDQAQRNGDAYAVHLNHKPGQMRDLKIAFNQTHGLLQLTGGGGEGIVKARIYNNLIYRAKYNGIALTTLDVKNLFEYIEIYNNEIISPKSLGIYIGPDKIWKIEKIPGRNIYRPVYASAYGKINKLKIYKNIITNKIIDRNDLVFSKIVAAQVATRPSDWLTKVYPNSTDVWKYYSRSSFSGIFIRANSENTNIIVSENKISCTASHKLDLAIALTSLTSGTAAVSNWLINDLVGANGVEIVSNQKGIEIGNDYSRVTGDPSMDGQRFFTNNKYNSVTFSIASSEYSRIASYYDSMDFSKLAKFQNIKISNNEIQFCREKVYVDSIDSGEVSSSPDVANFANINYGTGFRYFKVPALAIKSPSVEYEFLKALPTNSSPTFYDTVPVGVDTPVEICPTSAGCNVRQILGVKGQDGWRESGEIKDSATKTSKPLIFNSSSSFRSIKRNGDGTNLRDSFHDW